MMRSVSLFASTLVLLFAAPIFGESPAAIADSGDARAQNSFEVFAKSWMERAQQLEAEQKKKPTVRPGARAPMVTYRGYGDDYSVELRPTGHVQAPYIGLLRYTEHVYSCVHEECTVASTVPVTEIFRFQDGRWIY
jgi:hypothetical protein